MRTSINLLSKSRKIIFRRVIRTRLVFFYGMLFLSIPVVAIVMLSILVLAAHIEKESVLRSQDNVRQHQHFVKLQEQDLLVQTTNVAIDKMYAMDEMQQQYSHALDVFVSHVPKNIHITQLSVDGLLITAQGIASNRVIVVSFVAALDDLECFRDVTVPLTGLVQRTDSNFILSATITDRCL